MWSSFGGDAGLAVGVAYYKIAYALVVALNSEGTKDFLALITFKLLFGTVHPTASEPERVSGEHHIAHCKAAVVNVCAFCFIRKHNEHRGRAVEGVCAICTHDFRIECGKLIAHSFIGDRNDYRRLPIASVCGVKPRVYYLVDKLLWRHIRFILFYAAA